MPDDILARAPHFSLPPLPRVPPIQARAMGRSKTPGRREAAANGERSNGEAKQKGQRKRARVAETQGAGGAGPRVLQPLLKAPQRVHKCFHYRPDVPEVVGNGTESEGPWGPQWSPDWHIYMDLLIATVRPLP